ncbi:MULTISPECIES: carbohydrate ABC transporter permease [Streptomyces]|jgi:N,N'-diacetylchitobiose transport system permease protein|uniref:Carbohydrate ABC transporter permease n=2 Tax=Streptomyces TaxID=1883 RepID=A0ABW6YWE0_9ACTN|nr:MULTISPECIES: sugar ABC transporter permease [Streptomyces]MCL3992162.1 sugar ABC transporter permease [Streptomyces lavenduligriseus]QIS73715.1 sugar ABC transporter permease [Streptomyces sp. DSM 40868]
MSVQTEGTDTAGEPAVRKARVPASPRGDDRTSGAPSRRRAAAPYLLLLPALAATLVLLGWPLVKNGMLSFQNLNPRQLIQHLTEWNGVDNYQEVLTAGEFWRVVERSVVFTAVNVTLIMVIGTLIGLLLARLGKRMRLLLLFGLVLAWAMPVIAATTVYKWLFAQRFGVVNWVLDKLGWHSMADHNWLETQFSTFAVVTLLLVWQSVPFVAINLYAATTTIPRELYEAAALDGAGTWKGFTSVTLPFLRPFLYATTFLEVIWIFKAFPQIFAMNEGGPDHLTETLPIYAFVEGVGNQHFGLGAAISFLTIAVLLVITSYYLRMVLKQEEDEL